MNTVEPIRDRKLIVKIENILAKKAPETCYYLF